MVIFHNHAFYGFIKMVNRERFGMSPLSVTMETNKIRTLIEKNTEIDENSLRDIKDLKKESYENKINLAILYVKCYNFISQHKSIEEVKNFIKNKKIEELFDLVEEYLSGSFGKYYNGERIKNLVKLNYDIVEKFITEFFEIFGEEE